MERSVDTQLPSGPFNSGTNPYLYNGKEIDRMNGLNENDYGGRWYNAAVGRWGSVDPLAEITPNISPYVYCEGNPVNRIDPTGMMGEASQTGMYGFVPPYVASTFVDKNNKIIEHRPDNDRTVYLVENEIEWINNGKSKVGLDRVGDEDPFINYNNKIGQTYNHFHLYDNFIDNLAEHMRNSGWEDEDKAFLKSFGPIIMGLVLLNPIIGTYNDAKTVFTSKDIYSEKVSKTDKYLSGISLSMGVTSGGLKLVKSPLKKAIKLLDRLSKAITVYSAAKETKNELKKDKK
jgi:RHS repeat-associated protein